MYQKSPLYAGFFLLFCLGHFLPISLGMSKHLYNFIITSALFIFPCFAHAILGHAFSTKILDQEEQQMNQEATHTNLKSLKASRKTYQHANKNFQVHEIKHQLRSTKHYVDNNTQEHCGISWRGQSHLDSNAYLDEDDQKDLARSVQDFESSAQYQNPIRKGRALQRSFHTKNLDIIFSGHMGAVKGYIIKRNCNLNPGDMQ